MEKISFGSIISKAVLLVGIIAAITFFQNQFGAENMLVGIALITALLMFLKADLGIKPSQAPFLIVGLFVAIVLVALLSNISPFAALAFNLVFIFSSCISPPNVLTTRLICPSCSVTCSFKACLLPERYLKRASLPWWQAV